MTISCKILQGPWLRLALLGIATNPWMTTTMAAGSSATPTAAADTSTSTTRHPQHASTVMPPMTVRFYWIRHGETVDNNQGLVVGQYDSVSK
jgi:hypothetical protein